jgi:hypothetical protein
VIFSVNIIKNPQVPKRRSIEKRKKSPRVSSNKRGSQYFERRKISTSKILFDVIPFSSPPSYHFKNPFQNH